MPKSRNQRRRLRPAGFTAIELMVTLAIVAILLAVAVPSFVSFTQTNRVAAEVNTLAGDLQFARAEAIKEGQPVTLCISSDGATCSTAGNAWQAGWIVFSDPNQNQTVDAGDLVLRKQIPWTSTDTFAAVGSSGSVDAVTYSRDGLAIGLGGTATWTLKTTPVNASATRCLTVNVVGHQQVQPC